MENGENLLVELFLNMMNWIGYLHTYKNLELVEPNNLSISFCGYSAVEDTFEFICDYNLEIFEPPIYEKIRDLLVHCLNCYPCIDEFGRVYEDFIYRSRDHDSPDSDFFDDLLSF